VRIRRVEIKNFRGIEHTVLVDAGDLNVLIGKNNSGKSTILDAISGFFKVVSSRSPIVDAAALHDRDSQFPWTTDRRRGTRPEDSASISVDLCPDRSERRPVMRATEMAGSGFSYRKARAGDYSMRVTITLTPTRSADSMVAFVSNIGIATSNPGDGDVTFESIFHLAEATALLTHSHMALAAQSRDLSRKLYHLAKGIDATDFESLKDEDEPLEDFLIRRGLPMTPPSIPGILRKSLHDMNGHAGFIRAIRTRAHVFEEQHRASLVDGTTESVTLLDASTAKFPEHIGLLLALAGSPSVLHLRDRREQVGPEEAKQLLSLKTHRTRQTTLHGLQETLRSLLGVSLDVFESDTSDHPEIDVDDVLVEMNGAGIREALRVVLDHELNSPHILLVEEPEVHLHPALEIAMFRYLQEASSRTQVFLTTHSTNFLDTAEMRNVYLTRRTPWVTATRLDFEQAEQSLLRELGVQPSALFMYDNLVFVEGESDERILREFAAKRGVSLGQRNVGFIHMEGGRNLTHFARAETIRFLTGRNVGLHFVLDRDEKSDSDIEGLRKRFSGIDAKLHVLERREIENYLLEPRAIAAFLKKDEATEEAVRAALDECADDLRQLAVRKRIAGTVCRPVNPDRKPVLRETGDLAAVKARAAEQLREQQAELDRRIAELSTLVAQENAAVDAAWADRRFDVVPGDELLSAVCQSFGAGFRKGRDGVLIAAEMEAGEIAPELATLLDDLVR
jgi:putative ATP-dependent endonuclease of OLD family